MFLRDKEAQAQANGLKQNFISATTPEEGAQTIMALYDMTRGQEITRGERLRGVEAFLQPENPIQQSSFTMVRGKLCFECS